MSASSPDAAFAGNGTLPAVSDRDGGLQLVASLGDRLRSSAIVVAVSGEGDGAPAVRAAAGLERRYQGRVSTIQVLDDSDRSLLAPLPSACTFTAEIVDTLPYAKQARTCRQQVSQWLGQTNVWPIHMSAGAAAYEISRFAEDEGAAMVVMGLRNHAGARCSLRDETTLTVARLSDCAVFAVAPQLVGFPRRAIVGVDFGATSLVAARAACDLLHSPTATEPVLLRLVYVDRGGVEAPHEDTPDTPGEALVRHLGVAAAFEQLVQEFAAPPGLQVDCVTRHGDAAAQLLACAEESRADLIVVGGRRAEKRTPRAHLDGVTPAVIRDGRCSVLVIPPSLVAGSSRMAVAPDG